MVDEIINRILDQLTGFNLCVAIIALLICIIVWNWTGADKAGQKKLKRQLKRVVIVFIIAGLIIEIHHLVPPKRFSSDVAGILVLRIGILPLDRLIWRIIWKKQSVIYR